MLKILIAVDGSELSLDGVHHALALVRQGLQATMVLAHVQEAPPYPGAKPHLLISADQWEDRDWLRQLVHATAAALPPPKKRKPKQ